MRKRGSRMKEGVERKGKRGGGGRKRGSKVKEGVERK